MRRVVILGSGFSHAVSASMPMTNPLAELVMARLRADGVSVPVRRFVGAQFEAWLSRIAEPQPDLNDADNARNRELFIRVSGALREVLVDCQNEAFADDAPWWLRRMVGALHAVDATVVTFNYDLLVEATVHGSGLFDDNKHRVSSDDIIRRMPRLVEAPSAGGGFRTEAGTADTFRYIKLHGSLDTFWVLGDAAGETIARWRLPGGWGNPGVESIEKRRQALPGREPFLVPPTATKTSFYSNPLSRQLWQDAAAALQAADQVDLVGYSIPVTDMVTSGMLSEALSSSTARVTVVNPSPDGVRERLQDLGIEDARIDEIGGTGACADFADRLDREAAGDLTAVTSGMDLPLAAGVASPTHEVAEIVEVTSDGTAVLRAGDAWRNPSLARSRVSLIEVAARGLARRAVVVWPGGHRSFVTRIDPGNGPSGAHETNVLRVTAAPPYVP